jgi:hypothetical protein
VVVTPQQRSKIYCELATQSVAANPLTDTPAWRANDLAALRFDQDQIQTNLDEDRAFASVFAVFGTARAGVAAGRLVGSTLAARLGATALFGPAGTVGSFVGGAIVAADQRYNLQRLAAVNARLTQLQCISQSG